MPKKARYIMIGGFLGAGKTTAVLRLAEWLSGRGKTVGLITNDQSVGLVDTAMLGSHGFAVEEITGGCFCCRFNSLVDAAERLSVESRPDVFIAEPVGSCTDLKASVSYPLRRMYGDDFTVAPLSVLVDPIRAMRILGVETGKAFSRKVVYVYGKQLEEAEVIVVNKIDLLTAERRQTLRAVLAASFPRAKVLEVSARDGTGLEAWFELIAGGELGADPSMDVDYELYAEGEALLGWMNCTVELSAGSQIDGNELVRDLARELHERLNAAGAEIAHLKMTLSPGDAVGDIAVLNLVRNDGSPEMSHSLQGDVSRGELIVNLRAEADPEVLKSVTLEGLETVQASRPGVRLNVQHLEHFRPGKPQPTYRLAEA
jgi:Ni2+-binding GTPase involved in maturation of urease and hydrogenase